MPQSQALLTLNAGSSSLKFAVFDIDAANKGGRGGAPGPAADRLL